MEITNIDVSRVTTETTWTWLIDQTKWQLETMYWFIDLLTFHNHFKEDRRLRFTFLALFSLSIAFMYIHLSGRMEEQNDVKNNADFIV